MDDQTSRRTFLATTASAAAAVLPATTHAQPAAASGAIPGSEHWATKRVDGQTVRLFAWRRNATAPGPRKGTILFVHGSSVQSTPVFDLEVPGRNDSSTMQWFARKGFDTWCFDCEGY